MRKLIAWTTMMMILAMAAVTMGADVAQLTVTLTLDGRVVSNPAGIDCVFSDVGGYSGSCSALFPLNTPVALYTEGVEFSEDVSTIPCGWNQIADVNTPPVFAVTMDTAQTVKANICLRQGPDFGLHNQPDGQNIYGPYLPVPDPVIATEPSDSKPMAVEDLADGSLRLSVGLPTYFGPATIGVDVYVGLTLSGVNGMWLFTPGGLQPLSQGLAAWKTNHPGPGFEKERLLEIPAATLALLPEGIYSVYVMVTPSGTTATWTLWVTYFNVQHFATNPFP